MKVQSGTQSTSVSLATLSIESADDAAVYIHHGLQVHCSYSERQESDAKGGFCQAKPAICRAFMHTVDYMSRQGRLEGSIELLLQAPDLRIGKCKMNEWMGYSYSKSNVPLTDCLLSGRQSLIIPCLL